MARAFAEGFYHSKRWIKCRNGFMQSKNYICERCGNIATICHHIEHLSESNIDDPSVALSWDNLQSLCLDCHNRIHGKSEITQQGLKFDQGGNLIKVHPPT